MSDQPSVDEVRHRFADVPVGWFCAGVRTDEELWELVTRSVHFSSANLADIVSGVRYSRQQADQEVVVWREVVAKHRTGPEILATLASERSGHWADLSEAQHQLTVALQRMTESTRTWPEPMQRAIGEQGGGIGGQEEYWPVPALHRLESVAERVALTDAVIKRLQAEIG